MSQTLTLYERTADLATVHEWLMESGGELTPEISELLDAAEGSFGAKAERVALKARELEAEAKAVKSERERLEAREKAAENAAKSLKRYLLEQMQAAEQDAIKGQLVTIRVQAAAPSARCTLPVEALPPELVRVIPERREFSSAAALEVYKQGGALPAGVEIVRTPYVRLY